MKATTALRPSPCHFRFPCWLPISREFFRVRHGTCAAWLRTPIAVSRRDLGALEKIFR
jgi:hypothetical protein